MHLDVSAGVIVVDDQYPRRVQCHRGLSSAVCCVRHSDCLDQVRGGQLRLRQHPAHPRQPRPVVLVERHRGQHDDRGQARYARRSQPVQKRKPVHLGQVQIEQYHVRAAVAQPRQPFGPARRLDDLERAARQQPADQITADRLVIDDQHPRQRTVAGPAPQHRNQPLRLDRFFQVFVRPEIDRLARVSGRGGHDDRDRVRLFTLFQLDQVAPGFVAEQHDIEHDRGRMQPFEPAPRGGDGASLERLIRAVRQRALVSRRRRPDCPRRRAPAAVRHRARNPERAPYRRPRQKGPAGSSARTPIPAPERSRPRSCRRAVPRVSSTTADQDRCP